MNTPRTIAWLAAMAALVLTGMPAGFADGVDNVHVKDGNITMVLKE